MTRTKGPGESALLLLDVIAILDKRHIPYAVVGAIAASFYGIVRASADADAVISLSPAGPGIQALARELGKAGFESVQKMGDLGDPIGAVLNVEDGFGNRVDLLVGIRRMPEDLFFRTVGAQFMGKPIRFVGVEDFIAMKIFAGSPRDLADAAGVLKVSGGRVDRTLLKKLARGYGKVALRKLKSLL